MKSVTELSEWIVDQVNNYLKERPDVTDDKLADLINVSESTVNRFKKHSDSHNPLGKTAFQFTRYFLDSDIKAARLLKDIYPSWYSTKGKRYAEMGSEKHLITSDLDMQKYGILLLSTMPKGARLEEIEKKFGTYGADAVKSLMNMGLIEKVEDSFVIPTKRQEYERVSDQYKLLKSSMDYIGANLHKAGKNLGISSFIYPVSNSQLGKIYDELQRHEETVSQIILDGENEEKVGVYMLNNTYGYFKESSDV